MSIPSGILIHPTVWPQYNQRYRQTDRHTGHWSRSIGQTVTCNSRPTTCGKMCSKDKQVHTLNCAPYLLILKFEVVSQQELKYFA